MTEDGIELFALRCSEVLDAPTEHGVVASGGRLVIAEEQFSQVVEDCREPGGSGPSRSWFPWHGRPECCAHPEQVGFYQYWTEGDESST